jgi:hypothetical protein
LMAKTSFAESISNPQSKVTSLVRYFIILP